MKPDLDAIRARCEAATPGPWTYDEDAAYIEMGETGYAEFKPDWQRSVHKQPPLVARTTDIWGNTEDDGRFIACARTDIPALLAYIDELERRTTYTVDETEWAHRVAVAEQKAEEAREERDEAEQENVKLREEFLRLRVETGRHRRAAALAEERALTAEERLERVTHERDQERQAFEQENLALRRELARLMDDH